MSRHCFRLYVAGNSPNSLEALQNFERLCRDYLANNYQVEIIDVTREPARALTDRVFLTPTLVRTSPEPVFQMAGTLADTKKVLKLLQIPPRT